ncbi:major facilitator superfamily domain-containing protein [Lentinula raphanica]|uniref:Major facilitator superfamily domain-containing protein n=1 Tax=Lentinula raphanica TaxID=153919 RepID=A0AA38PAB5_9AGAR|nr:major facilitator superfamily domain-containing protein [Lentinula raphanica]
MEPHHHSELVQSSLDLPSSVSVLILASKTPPLFPQVEEDTKKLHSLSSLSSLKESIGSSEDSLPDVGLRAWAVLFGAMCIAFTTSGYISTWGVFQAHYEQSLLEDMSPSMIAWIGSIQQSCLYIPTYMFTRLADRGYFHTLLVIASIVFIVATILVAQCTSYWQFLLCQGMLTGITAGVFTGPVTAVLSQWFDRRRGLALGLYAAGSSLGGTVMPIIARELFPIIGFEWTVRVIASIIMVGMALGNMTIKERTSCPKELGKSTKSSPMQSKVQFVLYCAASFFTYLGYYTFTTYVASSAISLGVSIDFAFYLVSICNASSGISRIVSGFVADRIGAMNLMIPTICLSTTIYYLWPCVHSKIAFVFVSALYGISIGPFASLVAKPVLDSAEKDQLGQRIGILMSTVGVAMLIGTPISGAFDTNPRSFGMGSFAGSTMLFGALLMAIFRYLSKK